MEKLGAYEKIFFASDHRGFGLKQRFIGLAAAHGIEAVDLGPTTGDRCDASDYAIQMAKSLRNVGPYMGVLICGSGQAMAMTANRFKHLRAALCFNATMARLAREHNDANVLVLGADIIGEAVAEDCLKTFLATSALEGRYAERVQKLTDLGGL